MRKIDFEEVQKAMEDTGREAFDYFLDMQTGDVIILSEDIIARTREFLEEKLDEDADAFDAVEFDEEVDLPDWMEDEVDLALDIFINNRQRYVRIPERDPKVCFAAMKEFTEQLADPELREQLSAILDGKGAFRKFKDALGPHPRERKQWYAFNAKATRREIEGWLQTVFRDNDPVQ